MKKLFFSILLVMLTFLFVGCDHIHKYEEEIVSPTCTTDGYTKFTCTCGDTKIEFGEGKVGHKYSGWHVIKEATEKNSGLKSRYCTVCEYEETEVIETVEHQHNYKENVINPTCTEDGYTEYTCECGKFYRDNVTPASHQEYALPGKKATCSEVGYSDAIICLVCNEILVEQEVIEATGNHSYSEWIILIQVTDTKDGLQKKTCLDCGYEVLEKIIAPLHEHKYTSSVVEPTCTENGYTKFECECGKQYFEDYTDALGHNEVEVLGYDATCTAEGLTSGVGCSKCNCIIKEQSTIPLLGHLEKELEGISPTCTKNGLSTGKQCIRCGEITIAQEIIFSLGHNEISLIGYPPTCYQDGLSDGTKCSLCDTILKEQIIIPAISHNFSDWLVLSEPTLTKAGTQEKECQACHLIVTEEIPVRIDEFIYNLVYSDLKTEYDTFVGYVDNGDSDVYGIAYVDYIDGYIDEEGKTYFSSGFVSFANQELTSNAMVNETPEINSLEENGNDLFSYVYSYSTEDVSKHCVIDNKYVKYDIINGVISYTEEDYFEGMTVDNSRGNVYNYDTEEYVYIVEELDYVPVSGVSLIGEATYKDIIDEANKILLSQSNNLTYSEVKSFVSQSQEALYSYLLGLQEETFMGIPTSELLKVVKNLDPMQHLRITVTEEGITSFELIEVTKLPTLAEKIAASLVGAFGIVAGVVCTAFGHPIIGGLIVGATLEIFSQVVLGNTPTSDIQWSMVAVSCVAGCLAGGLSSAIGGIAVTGTSQLLIREAADTLVDGLIGGSEFFVNALIAGKSFNEACKEFGYGVVTGAVLSGIFKVGFAAVKGGAKLVKKVSSTIVSDINGKAVTKLSNETVTDGVSELQEKTLIKKTTEFAENSLAVNKVTSDEKLMKKLVDNLPSSNNKTWGIMDEFGNPISKGDLIKNGGNGYIYLKDLDNVEIVKYFNDNNISKIRIENGSISFKEVSKYNISFENPFTTNRTVNFNDFNEALVDELSLNPQNAPKFIKDYCNKMNIDLEYMTTNDVKRMMGDMGLTWHESADCMTAYMVPQIIHNVADGGISHMGGISMLKYLDAQELLKKMEMR